MIGFVQQRHMRRIGSDYNDVDGDNSGEYFTFDLTAIINVYIVSNNM